MAASQWGISDRLIVSSAPGGDNHNRRLDSPAGIPVPATRDLAPRWAPYPGSAPDELRLVVRRRVMSPELRNFRDLVAALPPSYLETDRAYPVVYVQDGQNLFDPATSHAGTWELAGALTALAREGIEAIVIGVPNVPDQRVYEYSPFRDPRHGGGGGDRYAAFLAQTVKPLVDRTLRTLPGPEHTLVAGSSLGGLVSLYAAVRFRERFGGAAVMSPSLWFAERAALGWAREWLPRVPRARLHLDVGSAEGAEAVADVRSLRDILVEADYRPGVGLDYVEDEGAAHHEAAWGRRFAAALPFLLGL